ncbi:hypothetical protein JJB07_00255 [Tumebacillus sp. ITR2]|uniref:3'-5' exonuclease n=1 Tax=Tumebacillus amylolyticus TaxID=2801339 RepID=A0ABS1J472_9BACL|nr:hypothetical protein [Tumebacillus amylolyticus]MBL0385061.1 hypothetical protein [Tumebacillus amylolyticus]
MEFFKDRVMCPRCEGAGNVYEVEIVELNKRFLICDETDCSWEAEDDVRADNWMYIFERLEKRYGVTYESVKFQNINYDWWKRR